MNAPASTATAWEGWNQFRDCMPVCNRWTYFDHAAVAPLPSPTSEVIRRWCQEATTEGDTAWPIWHRAVQQTRHLAAQLIGARPEEIALVANTTAGITLVAEGFPWSSGDNVVTLANEFPSNIYPWMNLASRGVETRLVAVPPHGRVCIDDVLSVCDHRTRIVSASWVGFASGARIDVPTFAEAVHARGAYFFLDAIQGLGVFPLDVQRAPVDFLAADGHKWMLGPEGAGIFYLRQEHLELLRPIGVGWNSVEHSFDFSNVALSLKSSASRFEGGTLNTGGFLGMGASLQLLAEHGLNPRQSPIRDRILTLTEYACDRLRAIGAEIVSPRDDLSRSQIVSFRFRDEPLEPIRRKCLEAGVVISCRNASLRMSPHAYNNEHDIDRLIDVLKP